MTIRTLKTTALAGLILVLLPLRPIAAQDPRPAAGAAEQAPALKDDKEKRSYAVGMNLGGAVRQQSAEQSAGLDVEIILKGFKDAFAGGKTLLTDAEMRTILNALQTELKSSQASRLTEKAAKAKSAGKAFLSENEGKDGVVTLPTGLQYKILKAGEGEKPTAKDSIVCHYRGTLIDGTEFDSSYKRGKPAVLPLAKVIKGWTEALQLMPVGSKWQLFIPPNLAYGDRGTPPRIGPNETLIFEIELISIQAGSGTAISPSGSLNVSFKLDPRVTKGLYLGDRWVSAPHLQRGDEKQVIVEARAQAVDASGKPLNTAVQWTAADPGIAAVTSGKGNQVTITVLSPGETTLHLTAGAVSTKLTLKAEDKGGVLEAQLTQNK